MIKFQIFSNFVLGLLRQYWKYKYRDLGMVFSTLVFTSGIAILLSDSIWEVIVAMQWFNIPTNITFGGNDYSNIGTFLIIFGLITGALRLVGIRKQLTGILIIHRGMEGMDTVKIQSEIPKSLSNGKLEIIDLHEGHQLHEGKVIHPERALDVINGLDQQIKSRLNGRDITEVKLAYGGLAPIPLLVAAGYKITSRQECLLLDYSRSGTWHGLDVLDDLEGIKISEPDEEINNEVAIIIPFSVDISEKQLPNTHAGKAYFIRLDNDARPDSLNSADKQKRIATEIYTLCANMKAKHPNINKIHLFIASQASFAFRLGSMLTPSVMPNVSVYQYDSKLSKYDWGVTISRGCKPRICNLS